MSGENTYYTLPLRLDNAIRGKQLEQTEIRKAIHQNIRLILRTLSLRYRFDPGFGSLAYKYNARMPPGKGSERAWREDMREQIQKNIKDMLQRYETRVDIRDVIVDIEEPDKESPKPEVKVKVEVFGQLSLGQNQQFYYPDREIDEDAQGVFPLVIPLGKGK